jgi:hypothetical protein
MQKVLQSPGAEVVIGLLSFALSFVALGLAVAALDPDGKRIWLALLAFIPGGLLMMLSLAALLYLCCCLATSVRQQKEIRSYLRQAYVLRANVLTKEWNQEQADAVNGWKNAVQDWLDLKLPDYSSDFALDTIHATNQSTYYGDIDTEASRAALLLEHRTTNLREILRDIRK